MSEHQNEQKLIHAKHNDSRITFNSTLRSRVTSKSKNVFTWTRKRLNIGDHESRINKSLNHVSQESKKPHSRFTQKV